MIMRILRCIVAISFVLVVAQENDVVDVPEVDPVTKALEYVEQIARQKNNCSFGPSLDLEYNGSRWNAQAEVAVRAANLLTTLSSSGHHGRGIHSDDEDILYTMVLSNVQNDDLVFGSAIAFYTDFYRDFKIFCPYAFRAPDLITAKDLSIGYDYTDAGTDWFHIPYSNFREYKFGLTTSSSIQEGTQPTETAFAETTLAPTACIDCNQTVPPDNPTTAGVFGSGYTNATDDGATGVTSDTVVRDKMEYVRLADGYWTKPYFDCGGGDVWMVTYSVPFFWSELNRTEEELWSPEYYYFAGVTTIDISLDYLDINQCSKNDTGNEQEGEIFDPFVGTDRCKNTTHCEHIPGQGFERGAYLCRCEKGFYFPPDVAQDEYDVTERAFRGSIIEDEYNKKVYGKENRYDSSFDCLPCPAGCDECVDDSPCFVETNQTLRWGLVAVNALCILVLLALGICTNHFKEKRVFKAASPGLLYVVLFGTALSYCETIIIVAVPSTPTPMDVVSCQGFQWFRYVGFCLAYGALLFKTWRITKVFTVRSAKPVRITDQNLYLRIALLLGTIVVFLAAWTFLDPSQSTLMYNDDNLKYYECSTTTWYYVGKAGELLLLAWGMYLCLRVRKAPSAFNESKFISVSIYNQSIITIFGAIISFVIPGELAGPNTILVIDFCRLHLTFSVMVAILFVSKILLLWSHTEDDNMTGSTLKSKKKQAGVFTLTGSNQTIEFTLENPDISMELDRMRKELVDLKEIAKLAPPDKSIVNRYKRALLEMGKKEKKDQKDASQIDESLIHKDSITQSSANEHAGNIEMSELVALPSTSNSDNNSEATKIASAFLNSLITKPLSGRLDIAVGKHQRDQGALDSTEGPIDVQELPTTKENVSIPASEKEPPVELTEVITESFESPAHVEDMQVSSDDVLSPQMDSQIGEHTDQVDVRPGVSQTLDIDESLPAINSNDCAKLPIEDTDDYVGQDENNPGSVENVSPLSGGNATDMDHAEHPPEIGDNTLNTSLVTSTTDSQSKTMSGCLKTTRTSDIGEMSIDDSKQALDTSSKKELCTDYGSNHGKTIETVQSSVCEEDLTASSHGNDASIVASFADAVHRVEASAESTHQVPTSSNESALMHVVLGEGANGASCNSAIISNKQGEKTSELYGGHLLSPPETNPDLKGYVNLAFGDSGLGDHTTELRDHTALSISDLVDDDKPISSTFEETEAKLELHD